MVMGKSWSMKNWQEDSWDFTNSAPEICACFAVIEKFSISLYFWPYPLNVAAAKRWSWKIEKQSWKSHRKVMEQRIAKSVGTLKK